jgi:c-di-GMP-binding flagellar brake protein YcgR
MNEKRKECRTIITDEVLVFDADYNEKLGKLVDISPKGLRIKGNNQIEINEELKLRLQLETHIFGKNVISLYARCLWFKQDEETDSFFSGFEFCQVSQEDSNIIMGFILNSQRPKSYPP